MRFCQYVVAYEEEPAGSDVADPRVRCGKPATIELEGGLWCCPEHAEIIHDSLIVPISRSILNLERSPLAPRTVHPRDS